MSRQHNIRDFHSHSKSSENLSPIFVFPSGHDDNILTIPVPVQRNLRPARSAENLTSHQHKPLPSTPHRTLNGRPKHALETPPKPPPRFNSPRPSISSIDEDWSGSSCRLLVNRASPRPSVTSLDAVTLGSTDCLDDDFDVYIKSQRHLTVGFIFLGGLVLVLLALVSLNLVWSVTRWVPQNKIVVAAHLIIDTAGLKAHVKRETPKPNEMERGMPSCMKGYELLPWMTDRGTATLKGIIFNKSTNRLIIADTGYYFVYSQVVFDKVGAKVDDDIFSDSLFHVMCKESPVNPKSPKDLLQATETPNKVTGWSDNDGTAFHTSHVSGVVFLLKGDQIYVKVSNLSLVHLVPNARTIFTGLFRLPTSDPI